MSEVRMSKWNAENLQQILFDVMMLGRQPEQIRQNILTRLIARSDEAHNLLEELAPQDEIFRYWP
jgi:hypothetical protein